MKEFLKQLVQQEHGGPKRRSVVREYLQARTLQALQDSGAFMNWAFLGGTALRFLYNIPRYSEDLAFSLDDKTVDCEFEKAMKSVKKAFEAETYAVNVKLSSVKTVMSSFIRFPGLLFEMGCCPHRSEVVAVKCEVDTNPPEGAETETTIARHFVTVNLKHYGRSSLLAGKLHAILTRAYTKGRDLYDLVWYLSSRSWPEPNLGLLNAALEQTGWTGASITETNWRTVVADRLSAVDWDRARDDLMPFLERQEDLPLVTYEHCMSLLKTTKQSDGI